MLDLPVELVDELSHFTETVRSDLGRTYGSSVITEHGRIAVCDFVDSHEPHCFHAHRLVFPIQLDLEDALVNAGLDVKQYRNFAAARADAHDCRSYLYYERIDGSCVVADANRGVERQFFRGIVASNIGHPNLRSWRAHPRLEVVHRARKLLYENRSRDSDS